MAVYHAQVLDCTLRDGAYLIDKKFGDDVIEGIIEGLVRSHVDLIEVGFFQDEGFGEGKTVFKNSQEARRFISKYKGNDSAPMFTVLADYSRYSAENLDECDGTSVDAVRACFFKAERKGVLDFCRTVKAKGYKLFVQPVDVLGYSDQELIDLIEDINQIEPYCFSIVDTFGSMYAEDLQRVFSLIDHNLIKTSKIGFHSHNNMQLSSALSQEFLRMSFGKREVVVDATLSGMGRGAGNTPTELIVQYMVSKLNYSYEMDALLDLIDVYISNIRSRCEWGYNTPYFLAGCYGAHVNNIAYLQKKNSIRSRDIRYILNKIGAVPRKRYDYNLLENTYLQYVNAEIDDSCTIDKLKRELSGRNILLLAPGKTVAEYEDAIKTCQKDTNAVTVSVSFIPENIPVDYLYLSNAKRYEYWKTQPGFKQHKKILTSNIQTEAEEQTYPVSFTRLVKCGPWDHLDNSMILLLRLLDEFDIGDIYIAGFDGYSVRETDGQGNYASSYLEIANQLESVMEVNQEISEMLDDYFRTRSSKNAVHFITPSKIWREKENG